MEKQKRRRSSYFGTMINPQRYHHSQIKFILILLPIILVMLLPIIFIIFHAFKPIDELYAFPPKFFTTRLTLDNFRNLFSMTSQTGIPLSRYLFNSLAACILVIFLSIIFLSLSMSAVRALIFSIWSEYPYRVAHT